METKKDAGKDQRVVLNLNMAQAKKVADGFYCLAGDIDGYGEELREFFRKMGERITKTISKHESSRGPEVPAEVMEAIALAVEEVQNGN